MASLDFVYGKARTQAWSGAMANLLTADVRAMLVTADYGPSASIDQFVSDIPSSAIVVRDVALTNKSFGVTGSFRGNIPNFNALASANTVVGVVLYIFTGTDSSSRLLYYSSGGPGFPFQPTGFDYAVGFDQSSGGWFQ